MPLKLFCFILLASIMVGCQSASVQEEPGYTKVVTASDLPSSNPVSKETPSQNKTDKEVVLSFPHNTKIEITASSSEKNVIQEPDTKPVTAAPQAVPPVATKEVSAPTPIVPPLELKKETPKPEPPKEKKPFYTLRLIALDQRPYYHAQCTKIEDLLKKNDVSDVFIYEASDKKGNKYWVVDAGRFDSETSTEAKEFAEKMRGMKFEGRTQFTQAYYHSKKD